MPKEPPKLDFRSKEEFRDLCKVISGRLHYLNRVAIGESGLAWEMADLIARAGRVFDEHLKDKDTNAIFGDGWTPGTISKAERHKALVDLLYSDKT